jgi:hypothetical protein
VARVALFVSKRLQRMCFALLCLLAAQLTLAVASCDPDLTIGVPARVSLR